MSFESHSNRTRRHSVLMLAVILALVFSLFPQLVGLPLPSVLADNPAPVQIFYVTLPEADALTVLYSINSDARSPIVTYFSIAIGVNGTYVYYDQWENGYDSDIANPTNLYNAGNLGGTQIWGNSNCNDGFPPNKNGTSYTLTDCNNAPATVDAFVAGDVVIPSSQVVVPRNQNTIYFDGKDKVGASSSISMARATWAATPGTVNAFAHEMYSTAEWGTAYEAPIGCNTANSSPMFEYSALAIMAAQNGTQVQIDADANSVYETTLTLNEAGAYLEGYHNWTSGCDYLRQGARVQSDKPIQVVLLTGDIGGSWGSRDMNLLPVSAFGTSNWSPVGVDTSSSGPTRLFVYNPSTNGSIYITCERYGVANTVLGPIAARGVKNIDLINNQGARCFASNSSGAATGEPIFAVGTVDALANTYDWSFTLYPDAYLSTEALVGLGLGRDPTSGTSQTQNAGPLWVTSACASGSTYVYVDWNNDGTADPVDTNGDGTAETGTGNGIQVTRLQSVRLFEPSLDIEPYDQTGARVWSRTTANVPLRQDGTPGCTLALAWGQDPQKASSGAPALDVGTSIPPLRLIEGTKSLVLKTDTDGDGVLSPGDVATYNITVKNAGSGAVNAVYIYDAVVPLHTEYNAGTTQKDTGSGWETISDDSSSTAFPLDVTGGVPLGNLAAGATFYVRFDVTLKNINVEGIYEEIKNCDIAYTGSGQVQSCTTNLVASNDWGDLPDTYGTSLAADGPRHSLSSSGLRLSAAIDRDLQGQPTGGADGDDVNQTTTPKADDEDGVVIAGSQPSWQAGTGGVVQVTVTDGPGCLNGWLDFTGDSGATPPAADGNFTKTSGYDTYSTFSEHIIVNQKVETGSSTVPVTVPPGTVGTAPLYFRFRLSPTDGSGYCTTAIAPTGFVVGGEVEDYTILPVDLLVTKSDGKATATSPGTIEYTLTIQNIGIGTASGVTLADTLGANLAYSSDTCPGDPIIVGSTYTWNLADLAAGQSTNCTVTVSVAGSLADGVSLSNYARADTTAFEVSVANNEASDIDTVLNTTRPNLKVTKTDNQTQVLAGDELTYIVSYENTGDAEATNVTLKDIVPEYATLVTGSISDGGTYDSVTRTITWNVGTVAISGSGARQFNVTVNPDLLRGAVILNHANIGATQTDYDQSDNSATDSDTVVAPYILTEKSVIAAADGGSPITYSIYWENNSETTAYNATIADTLPANTSLVAGSISNGGTEAGGTINWDLGDVAAGASGTVSFQVTADVGAGGATQTPPTLSTEAGSGSVTVVSKTTAYSSLSWCDSAYNVKCLTYRGLYNGYDGVGPTGWNENPRGGAPFDDSTWIQPFAAFIEPVWLPASVLDAEWTTVHYDGVTAPNYSFFRQAFCLPLNATEQSATLSLSGDDKSSVYLNGVYVGEHTSASSYSTFSGSSTAGIQSGINILAVRLLNNTHNGHPIYNGADHSGLLFNLQASYASVRPFTYAPAMTLAGQDVTFTADETALGGRKPFMYTVSWGDGTSTVYQNSPTFTHTYATPGTYVATVTARAQYGCTGTDQVTITVLPAGSNLLANAANVEYYNKETGGVQSTGQSGAGSLLAGTIGDMIWLDEDGDGVQDAGEAGIANVKVTITKGSVTYTTYTDANGNYVFANVPTGAYTVSVDPASLPAGLAANPTYDEDHTLDNSTSVTVTAGGEHMTADFGYNWSTTNETNNNTGTGAIGDRIWIDADGDGVQDAGAQDAEEVGLSGVTVELVTPGPDGLFGTADDAIAATTTTDATGNYIFDGLAAGAYVVRIPTAPSGYTLTGDSDQPGTACTTCDGKTTAPILLAPGDVYVNADFGYKPDTDNGATIGDQVWLDANGNGAQDGADTGIAGVTVALIKDTNGDGVYQPGVDPIIATDITDANGYYLFSGVPVADGTGTDDYLVWVNDTANVLAGLRPAYDRDGVATPGVSGVNDLAAGGNFEQDFGYAPSGQTPGQGLIGDAIFLDLNSSNGYDPGEGLEGVTVRLYADEDGDGVYDTGERLVAQTTTDENGSYAFADLPAGDYVVAVDTATLPTGLTNTVDPNADTTPNEAGVALAAGEVKLGQDFGYKGTNSVSGTIWTDADADGFMDSAETVWLARVTVVLRDSSGDIVATTTTDDDGNYSFANLPDGTYTVDVNDEANVLNGYWHSLGTANTDGFSQSDPLTVTLNGNQTIVYADFGYYRRPAALGNYVWNDTDADGIQDASEPGINGVKVTLTAKYAGGTTYTVATVTGDDPSTLDVVEHGWYSFGNLLLDEDTATSKTGEPTSPQPVYTLAAPTAPVGYERTLINQGTNDMLDSDSHAGVDGLATQGQQDVTRKADSAAETNPIAGYDFGFKVLPTGVVLAGFAAEARADHILVTWETNSEIDNRGFNLYRGTSAAGWDRQLNSALIPSQSQGNPGGFVYTWEDRADLVPGTTYYYWVEDVDIYNVATMHGPVSVDFTVPTAVILSGIQTTPAAGPALPLAGTLLALLAPLAGAMAVRRRRT